MELSQLITSSYAMIAYVAAIVTTIFKTTKAILHFNDEFLRKRSFKHYEYLSDQASGDEKLSSFISGMKRDVVFRTLFKKPASPRLAYGIMELYESKYFSLKELQKSFYYTSFDQDGRIKIDPGSAGNWIFGIGIILWIFLFVPCMYLIDGLIKMHTTESILAAFGFFLFALIFSLLISNELLEVYVAKRCKKKIFEWKRVNQGNMKISDEVST